MLSIVILRNLQRPRFLSSVTDNMNRFYHNLCGGLFRVFVKDVVPNFRRHVFRLNADWTRPFAFQIAVVQQMGN